MNLGGVLHLLQQRTGLDPETLGAQTIRCAVQGRLRQIGEADVERYTHKLASDAGEFAELVSAVMVSETWFYRGGALFDYLAEFLASFPRPATRAPLRVLSLPCSSGEEPYSLAMALQERGVPREHCSIEGVDINPRCIERARLGVYYSLSFRQLPPVLQQRYFRPSGAGLEIDPSLRARVQFRVGNLFDRLLTLGQPYHLVLCRNLFIYLDQAARQRGLEQLQRLVAPEGLLCLGSADLIGPVEGNFERIEPVEFCLFRKRSNDQQSSRRAEPLRAETARPFAPHRPAIRQEGAAPTASLASEGGFLRSDRCKDPRVLADQGLYTEALICCERLLQQNGPSADLYALLATLHLANQNAPAAAACLQRALYLDPRHREALWQQWLLHRSRGEFDRAERILARLERLDDQGDPT